MRYLAICNPAAGQGRPRLWRDRLRHLFPPEISLDLVSTESPGAAERIAAEAVGQVDAVLVLGGDGTVNEVANALAGTEVPLGIIPLGTSNVLARDLGLQFAPQQAVGTVLTGAKRKIDLGLCNGRRFALMVGCGFDAHVAQSVNPYLKDSLGAAAYVEASLRTLATHQNSFFTLAVNGESFETEALMVVVANCSRYAYSFKLASHVELDDGCLDLCVFGSRTKLDVLRQAANFLLGRLESDRQIAYSRIKTVSISANPQVGSQIDGEPFQPTPLHISVEPAALTVFVPPEELRRIK
jgi:YegS/Rv2252/BmrU family lipid kinase